LELKKCIESMVTDFENLKHTKEELVTERKNMNVKIK
jgi:hypothetical protein